jgi:DNA-directed RNA polymerase specialized sigma24 family protein
MVTSPAIERSTLASALAVHARTMAPVLLSKGGVMNYEHVPDRKRSRVARTTRNDPEMIGLGQANFDISKQHTAEPAPARSLGSKDSAWHRLLNFLANANSDAPEAAVYENARNRLLQFFAARGKREGEELADATFDRVVAKLSDEVVAQVRSPVGYMLRFAHFIYLEHIKSEIARHHRLAALQPDQVDSMENAREEWLRNERLALVERCLDELAPAERGLLRAYYMHDGRSRIVSRQKMSRQLGITPALLRTRVSRLLDALGQRVRALAEEAALA